MASRKRTRTLAEELEDLANPAPALPDVDPELHDFGTEAALASRFEVTLDDDELPSTSPAAARGRLQLRGDISLEGREYGGKRSSRKALEEPENTDESDQEAPDEEATLGARAKQRDEKKAQPMANGTMDHDAEESEGGVSGDETASVEEDDESPGERAGITENEEDKLEQEYRILRQQEEDMLASVRARSSADVEKGRAVMNQRVLWDRWLEMRIQLQKLLVPGNRLPQPKAWEVFHRSSKRAAEGMDALAQAAAETITLVQQLQQALMDRNEAIGAAAKASADGADAAVTEEEAEGASTSGRTDSLWKQMEAHYQSLAPFRNAAIDRWQRKALLSTGAAAAKGRLRALNQSVSAQVAAAMRDPTNLVQRTQGRAPGGTVLGQALWQQEAHQTQQNGHWETGGLEHDANGESAKEAETDPEIFNDTDFYQQLLKEFLDQSGATSNMSLYNIQKLRNKKKKTVDRRASKGRKLRYTVQQPLVNFMAPEPMVILPMADKLFVNLFGNRPAH